MILVPSLGILLFNIEELDEEESEVVFSSPLWGFFYLMNVLGGRKMNRLEFSSPLWGFFYLIFGFSRTRWSVKILVPSLGILLFNELNMSAAEMQTEFSSPLWGFFYLILR